MVTLGADISAALPSLRAEAESRMTDAVEVGLFADGVDEAGDPTRTLVTERYTGIGRIRWASREVSNSSSTGSPASMQEPYLSVPFGTARLFIDDEVVCTASEDPLLVGRTFRVQGAAAAGQVTAYRYPLEDLG